MTKMVEEVPAEEDCDELEEGGQLESIEQST